jgi:hypothetical protein
MTHDLARLLLELGTHGVELAPHPDQADKVRYRPATLPPDLLERLRTHRAALRALLDGFTPADPEAFYILTERLGIADDSKMSTHPGAPAWLIAIGESIKYTCVRASIMIESEHESTGETDSIGGKKERAKPLCDQHGIRDSPVAIVAADERRE